MPKRPTLVVVGGGIVGLACARRLALEDPGYEVVLVDKEQAIATHQSGHNSGVVHSGIYYAPGSLKAKFAIAGNASMATYARSRGIPFERTGKLIVATHPEELPRLHSLYRRGLDHGLEIKLVGARQAREIEPNVATLEAVHVASTGVIDFAAVAAAFAQDLTDAGGRIELDTAVRSVQTTGERQVVLTDRGVLHADRVVACAGLHSDHIAHASGADSKNRIVAFRGEYHLLTPQAANLVRGLVYPVPDPDFPFLGVHLTRGIDGSVHAGPNAVLALAREGYRWRDFSAREVTSLARHGGFRRLARRHLHQGLDEILTSVSRPRLLRELQRLLPALESHHLVRSPSGVRAQALSDEGELIDDFLLLDDHGHRLVIPPEGPSNARTVHVLNAPSPAATSSLEIASAIARTVELSFR